MTKSQWLQENWHTIAFLVYASICIFDFIIMPGMIEFSNRLITPQSILAALQQIKDVNTQTEYLKAVAEKRQWVPLTMASSAAFHLAFGTLLTSAAWTRGQERIEQARQQTMRMSVSANANPK